MNKITKRFKSKILSCLCLFTIILSVLVETGCNLISQKKDSPFTFAIYANAETDPVNGSNSEDAADDPAIWYNKSDPSASLIFGTDKKGGIAIYGLDGHLIEFYPVGLANNADVRYNFNLGGEKVDILGFSNRSNSTIDIYRIYPGGRLENITDGTLKPSFTEEIYGFCLYRSKNGGFYAFINNKLGEVEEWKLDGTAGRVKAELIKNMKVPTQVEGMVADDETGVLYVAEEDSVIWKFDASESGSTAGKRIADSYIPGNSNLKDDLEGLAIYYERNGGYLIASSQGNNTYAVFNRLGNNEYIGSFSIVNSLVDGTSETDGIEVINFPLNSAFTAGILVVQDGSNSGPGGERLPQNYKIVDWKKIVSGSAKKMDVNTSFNPVVYPPPVSAQ